MKIVKILILLLIISCQNNEDLFSFEDVKNFSLPVKKEHSEVIIMDMAEFKEYVFVKISNSNKIAKISIEDLQVIYDKNYKNDNYTMFLYKVLNLRKTIPITFFCNYTNIHTLKHDIMELYEKEGINKIKTFYTIEKEKGKFYVKYFVDDESMITIQYLFYINKYEYYEDDYIPLMWFEKNENFSLYKTK